MFLNYCPRNRYQSVQDVMFMLKVLFMYYSISTCHEKINKMKQANLSFKTLMYPARLVLQRAHPVGGSAQKAEG